MKRYLPCLVILVLLMELIGCSYINPPSVMQGRDKYYLTAKTAPPLRVPPGLATNQFKNDYPIPERHYPDSARTVNITPPGL